MKQILAMTRKELNSYFGSPMALIFLGAFLAATLFSFFWVNTFFARGIADVRPLFQWMPILLIFLVAALTMRQWSEEQQSGTLEILLTLPVRGAQLVIGKFLAVMALIGLALALTLFLPITVSLLGNLDWGPVWSGYLGIFLMGSAVLAIGLSFSSFTDNQLVAFFLSCFVSFLLVFVTGWIMPFLSGGVATMVDFFSFSSHLESLARGVIDTRDVIYFLSISGFALMVAFRALESRRWS